MRGFYHRSIHLRSNLHNHCSLSSSSNRQEKTKRQGKTNIHQKGKNMQIHTIMNDGSTMMWWQTKGMIYNRHMASPPPWVLRILAPYNWIHYEPSDHASQPHSMPVRVLLLKSVSPTHLGASTCFCSQVRWGWGTCFPWGNSTEMQPMRPTAPNGGISIRDVRGGVFSSGAGQGGARTKIRGAQRGEAENPRGRAGQKNA